MGSTGKNSSMDETELLGDGDSGSEEVVCGSTPEVPVGVVLECVSFIRSSSDCCWEILENKVWSLTIAFFSSFMLSVIEANFCSKTISVSLLCWKP